MMNYSYYHIFWALFSILFLLEPNYKDPYLADFTHNVNILSKSILLDLTSESSLDVGVK